MNPSSLPRCQTINSWKHCLNLMLLFLNVFPSTLACVWCEHLFWQLQRKQEVSNPELRAWIVGADEPSGAAAAVHGGWPSLFPCLTEWSACLSYTLSELGEKEYFNPSVFNLLAVDFFLPYEVEGTIEVKPQWIYTIKPQARYLGEGDKLVFCNGFLRNTNIWVLAIITGK